MHTCYNISSFLKPHKHSLFKGEGFLTGKRSNIKELIINLRKFIHRNFNGYSSYLIYYMLYNLDTIGTGILNDLLPAIINFLVAFLGAVVVLIIGWIIAKFLGGGTTTILKRLNFNKVFEKGSWKHALENSGLKVDPASFIGEITQWSLIIIFLSISVGILGPRFSQFSIFLTEVVLWLPNVVVAAAIFIVAVIIADYLGKIMRAWAGGMNVGYGHIVEVIVRWAVWAFAIVAILLQLGIATSLVMLIVSGTVYFLVIAGGIAFGLGGKEVASEILQNLYKKIK